MAIVAYFIFFLPLLTASKDDPFVKYHVKQSVALLVVGIAFFILESILPFGFILSGPVGLGMFVLWVIGVMHAAQGKMEPVPVIGQFADKIFNY